MRWVWHLESTGPGFIRSAAFADSLRDAPRGEGDVAEGVVCGCWDSVETSASRSPLSSGVGSLGLIKMQGTGWQAAAAAYTQNPGRKGMAGAVEEKPTKDASPPHLPRFGVLIP